MEYPTVPAMLRRDYDTGNCQLEQLYLKPFSGVKNAVQRCMQRRAAPLPAGVIQPIRYDRQQKVAGEWDLGICSAVTIR
jgi:hypothetical protein